MRVLVIGYPLPDASIDNYNVLSAPSYSDYDAVVIDPASVTQVVGEAIEGEREFEAFDGRPVLNAPTTATAVSIADQVRRRLDETRNLLEAGGSVIVFGRPNAQQAGVLGFEGCDRYSWLPAPGGLAWSPPYLRAAEGKTIRVVAEDHPLASLLREFRGDLSYRATFDLRQAEVRQTGRVLAGGGANVPIGMEFRADGGRIVFMPAPVPEPLTHIRGQMAEAIVELCRRLTGMAPNEPAPYWVRTLALPGLEQAEAEREELERAAEEASNRLEAAREREASLEQHRQVLWEDGLAFQRAVANTLRMIGFVVEGGGETPLTIRSEGTEAFLEVESSRNEVVEWPYVRLQRRLEERLLATSENLKGVIVANGHRAQAPESRGEAFTPALRIACENYRYSLLTAETLFALVQRALGGASDEALSGMRRRILRTNGLLETTEALGDAEERRDSGPIF